VTLNVDTTKVPTLAAASNTFTGSITASSFTGGGSGLTGVNAGELGGVVPSGYAQLAVANAFTMPQTVNAPSSTQTLYVYNGDNTDSGTIAINGYALGPNSTGVEGVGTTGISGGGSEYGGSFTLESANSAGGGIYAASTDDSTGVGAGDGGVFLAAEKQVPPAICNQA
jgi:hypothetical protein